MKNILIIGAGRSATALINYMLDNAKAQGWFITVADADPQLAQSKVGLHSNGRATWLDVSKPNDRAEIIMRNDIIVSLLPAHLHLRVAKDCVKYRKHLVTASYVSRELYRLGDEVREAELIFMGEMGLDPGIDHMSAMKTLNELRDKGAKINSFSSYAGGLVAPESDDNPWHYKISWNPRNVVLAGQGTAQYLEDNKYKYIPYPRLFRQYKLVEIPGMGTFEAYANRDSLLYRDIYNLEDIPNILRATLRRRGFCDAWSALVRIGLTDGSYPIMGSKNLTYFDLMEAYLSKGSGSVSVRERMARLLKVELNSEVMRKLEWLGLFDKKRIRIDDASPAQILQELLERKWKLNEDDKDMIVMQHEFLYELEGRNEKLTSTMIMKGSNSVDTAMSRLVGLPLAIFVKLICQDQIKSSGVQIPVQPEVYNPVLKELEDFGVIFKEQIEVV
ncbi:MAG: saccharopine dehydrogenase C-terminal domain-containing protein [Bacteroidota bacterium]